MSSLRGNLNLVTSHAKWSTAMIPRQGILRSVVLIVTFVLPLHDVKAETIPGGETADHIAIFDDQLPGVEHSLAPALTEYLGQQGLIVSRLSPDQAIDPFELTTTKYFLYIIPNCQTYPAKGLDSLRLMCAMVATFCFWVARFWTTRCGTRGPAGWIAQLSRR